MSEIGVPEIVEDHVEQRGRHELEKRGIPGKKAIVSVINRLAVLTIVMEINCEALQLGA